MTHARVDIRPEAVSAVRDGLVRIDGRPGAYDRLLEMIGDARVVLLGEASHGTHEFYRERAAITKRLIEEKGFDAVAIEAAWPDAHRVTRFVQGADDDAGGRGCRGRGVKANRSPAVVVARAHPADEVEDVRLRSGQGQTCEDEHRGRDQPDGRARSQPRQRAEAVGTHDLLVGGECPERGKNRQQQDGVESLAQVQEGNDRDPREARPPVRRPRQRRRTRYRTLAPGRNAGRGWRASPSPQPPNTPSRAERRRSPAAPHRRSRTRTDRSRPSRPAARGRLPHPGRHRSGSPADEAWRRTRRPRKARSPRSSRHR